MAARRSSSGSFFSRMEAASRVSGAALLALFWSGCSAVTYFRGFTLSEETLFVNGLPPIKQDAHHACGAACVAAVAAYWDKSLAEFKSACPEMPREASAVELQALAEKLGLNALLYRGSMADLEDNLRGGRPLIVMIQKPWDPSKTGSGPVDIPLLYVLNEYGRKPSHWVVIVGITKDKKVILHDPALGLLKIKEATFNAWWKTKENICLLIVPL